MWILRGAFTKSLGWRERRPLQSQVTEFINALRHSPLQCTRVTALRCQIKTYRTVYIRVCRGCNILWKEWYFLRCLEEKMSTQRKFFSVCLYTLSVDFKPSQVLMWSLEFLWAKWRVYGGPWQVLHSTSRVIYISRVEPLLQDQVSSLVSLGLSLPLWAFSSQLLLSAGSQVHFSHLDMNHLDHMPINWLLQLAGVQQTLDFSAKPKIIHV